MKGNSIFTETLEQLISTAKGTSSQWVKFAKENPISQELMALYPEYIKLGNQFVDEQKKELNKLFKTGKAKSPKKNRDESAKNTSSHTNTTEAT